MVSYCKSALQEVKGDIIYNLHTTSHYIAVALSYGKTYVYILVCIATYVARLEKTICKI